MDAYSKRYIFTCLYIYNYVFLCVFPPFPCTLLYLLLHVSRYVPPLKPATSRWSLELPDNPQALQEELSKQESLLNQLHEELAAGKADTEKEEQIWEVQRVCTQLKRKVRNIQHIEQFKACLVHRQLVNFFVSTIGKVC